MTFNEYQAAAKRTAIARGTDLEVYERVLGLVGETGEIAEKFKKNIRDQGADLSKLDKADMAKELGDVFVVFSCFGGPSRHPFARYCR